MAASHSSASAKLCFRHEPTAKESSCFVARVDAKSYQDPAELSIVDMQGNGEPRRGLLFIARHRGLTVGAVQLLSLWVYSDEQSQFRNILPVVTLTELSDRRFFGAGKGEMSGVFMTADRIWSLDENELLYGSHRFIVKIHRYTKGDSFRLINEYTTRKKYPYSERIDGYEVINGEVAIIRQILSGKVR